MFAICSIAKCVLTQPRNQIGFSINAARRHFRETGCQGKSGAYLNGFSNRTTVSSFRMTRLNTKRVHCGNIKLL
jgi:hypothetical protein